MTPSGTTTRRSVAARIGTGFAVVGLLALVGLIITAVVMLLTRAAEHTDEASTATARDQLAAPPATLQALLDHQATSLVRGDLDAFVADIDPGRTETVAQLRRWFETLRALKVTGWLSRPARTEALDTAVPAGMTEIETSFCLGVLPCKVGDFGVDQRQIRYAIGTTAVNGRLVISSFQPAIDRPKRRLTMPWQLADISVAAGERAIVAAPSELESRLPEFLRRAEAAAENADRFAKWMRPAYYFAYLTPDAVWTQWMDNPREHAAGVAFRTSGVSNDVMVKVSSVRYPLSMDFVLRHEFGHTATQIGSRYDSVDQPNEWVDEGIAEYIAMDQFGIEYYNLAALRAYVKEGRFDGSLERNDESTSAYAESAFYATSYLAIKYIAEKFGQERMMAFVGETVQQRRPASDVAERILQVDFKNLASDIKYYVYASI